MISSADLMTANEVARSVVRAQSQPAFVIQPEDGSLVAANQAGARLLGTRAAPSLFDALTHLPPHVAARLRATPRSSLPRLVRLQFHNEMPQLFQASLLIRAEGAQPAMILLLANKSAEIVGKIVNLRAYGQRVSRARALEDQRAHVLREEAVRFKHLSETDALTGLMNLRAFRDHVDRSLQDRPSRNSALVFIDLDDFKGVNDRFGHNVGAQVLREVAKRLTFPPQTWIRVGRMGGDEFAVWLPGVRAPMLADAIAGLRARVNVTVPPRPASHNRPIPITASLGGACCPGEATDFEALKRLADMRMYEDKTTSHPVYWAPGNEGPPH